jgi:hypothetical protein
MEGSPIKTEDPIKGARKELNVVINNTIFLFTASVIYPLILFYHYYFFSISLADDYNTHIIIDDLRSNIIGWKSKAAIMVFEVANAGGKKNNQIDITTQRIPNFVPPDMNFSELTILSSMTTKPGIKFYPALTLFKLLTAKRKGGGEKECLAD